MNGENEEFPEEFGRGANDPNQGAVLHLKRVGNAGSGGMQRGQRFTSMEGSSMLSHAGSEVRVSCRGGRGVGSETQLGGRERTVDLNAGDRFKMLHIGAEELRMIAVSCEGGNSGGKQRKLVRRSALDAAARLCTSSLSA
ncbi:uncharacterized protein AB9W97_016044 isoform 1-T2 [Spinachia spinachia]